MNKGARHTVTPLCVTSHNCHVSICDCNPSSRGPSLQLLRTTSDQREGGQLNPTPPLKVRARLSAPRLQPASVSRQSLGPFSKTTGHSVGGSPGRLPTPHLAQQTHHHLPTPLPRVVAPFVLAAAARPSGSWLTTAASHTPSPRPPGDHGGQVCAEPGASGPAAWNCCHPMARLLPAP
jgi:hypothetical protein